MKSKKTRATSPQILRVSERKGGELYLAAVVTVANRMASAELGLCAVGPPSPRYFAETPHGATAPRRRATAGRMSPCHAHRGNTTQGGMSKKGCVVGPPIRGVLRKPHIMRRRRSAVLRPGECHRVTRTPECYLGCGVLERVRGGAPRSAMFRGNPTWRSGAKAPCYGRGIFTVSRAQMDFIRIPGGRF